MMTIYNFFPLNSFDLSFDLFSRYYFTDIVSIYTILILCGGISILYISFILYSSRLGEKIIKNAPRVGKIAPTILAGIGVLDSTLNMYDRNKDGMSSEGSVGSGGSENNDKSDKSYKEENREEPFSFKEENKNNQNNDNNNNTDNNRMIIKVKIYLNSLFSVIFNYCCSGLPQTWGSMHKGGSALTVALVKLREEVM